MIPIELTIQGIYSYQKKQIIDFSKLTQSKLFGVFGNVGSGKSAIIEAIVFVIYGETDRLNKSGDDRLYNMMNLKSDNMLIDFQCYTGKEGKEKYRFVYKGKRNSKQFELISKHERNIYKEVDSVWTPVGELNAEAIIGMDYKNFNRTIIIPQGKFKDFISLGPTDRARMLKELFGLEKFELYNKTKEIYGVSKGQFDTKSEIIKRFDTISDELLEETIQKQSNLLSDLKEVNNAIGLQRKEVEKLKVLEEQTKAQVTLKKEFVSLNEKKPIFDGKKQKLSIYQTVYTHFNDKIIQLKELKKEVSEKLKNLNALKQHKEDVNKELLQIVDLEKAIVEKVGDRQKAAHNINDLNAILSVIDLDKKMLCFQQSFIQLNEKVQNIIVEEKKTKTKNQELSGTLDQLKKTKIDISTLKDIEKWFESCSFLKSDVEKYKKSLDEKKGELDFLKSKKAQIIQQYELFDKMEEVPSFEDCLNNSESTFEEIERDYLILQQKIVKLQAKKEITAVSSSLKQGEECPLCGSLEHPNPCSPDSYENDLKELEERKIVVDQKMRSLKKVKEELEKVYIDYQSVSGILNERRNMEEELVKRLQTHYDLFTWKDYSKDDPSKMKFDLTTYDEQQKKIEAIDVELKSGMKSFEQIKMTEDQLKEQLKLVEIDIRGIEEQIKLKLGEVVNPKLIALRDKDCSIVEGSLKKGTAFLHQLEQINEKKIIIDKEFVRFNTRIESEEKASEVINMKCKGLEEKIDALVHKYSFTSLDEVIQILQKSINIEQEKILIDSYFAELSSKENQLKELEEKLKDVVFNSSDYENRMLELDQLEKQKSILDHKNGSVNKEIVDLQKQLKEKMTLGLELEGLGKRLDTVKVLLDLFKSSGFVQYVSSIFLKNLVISANDRFLKLTNNSLSLELDEKNNFIVRDFMNDGKTRLLKTLSGGQTFQASLCLALSLAENVKILNQSDQSFFFLDEGFGALDKSSLSVVFDTLKSLEQENRIVGVISHVEELKQEISVSIDVSNDIEEGSQIKYSWE